MQELSAGNQRIQIDSGELVSYRVDNYEYIHQKGSPGWRNSDTEMFPVIGPTADAGFRVQVPKGNAIQDQHGLLREMDYEVLTSTTTSATFQKNYQAGTVLENSKFPDKSTAQRLIWPYSFKFSKQYTLSDKKLQIVFTVSGEKDMPFMLGYHPAFKLRTAKPFVNAGDLKISLEDVLSVGSRALQISDCTAVTLMDKKNIKIQTEGFKNFMCWTEVPNMICIEPITFYPYAVAQDQLHQGFDYLKGTPMSFKVELIPQ